MNSKINKGEIANIIKPFIENNHSTIRKFDIFKVFFGKKP